MRSAVVIAVIAAVLLGGCNRVTVPKPNPRGDSAFVAGLKTLCSKTPALAPLDPAASLATTIGTANADNAIVIRFVYGTPIPPPPGQSSAAPVQRKGGLVTLTPGISFASPLAVPVTQLAQAAIYMSKQYGLIAQGATSAQSPKLKPAERAEQLSGIRENAGTVLTRWNELQNDLTKVGVSRCLRLRS